MFIFNAHKFYVLPVSVVVNVKAFYLALYFSVDILDIYWGTKVF